MFRNITQQFIINQLFNYQLYKRMYSKQIQFSEMSRDDRGGQVNRQNRSIFANSSENIRRSQDFEVPISELSGDQNAEKFKSNIVQKNKKIQKANFFLSIMTIMKTVIGVGILGLPYVFSQLGWGLGTIIFIITAILNQYTCYLLVKCKNMAHRSNYSSIGYYITNAKTFLALLHIIVIFNNLGVCMAELTIFKEIIQEVAAKKIQMDVWYVQSWFVLGICIGLVLIPLILQKKIQRLRFLAFIGITAISIFMIGLIANFFNIMVQTNWVLNPSIRAFPQPGSAWSGIASVSNVLLAFLYQMNFFPIYKGMKDVNDKKMLSASLIGTILCFIMYLTVGLLGYLSYGNLLNSNYLLALTADGAPPIPTALYIYMNVTFLSSVFCSFPVIFFGARNNFIALIKLIISSIRLVGIPKQQEILKPLESQQNIKKQQKLDQILFYVLTFILYIIILTLAITIGNLGKIFNLVGGISANAIGFILPSFFYVALLIKLQKKRHLNFYLALLLFCVTLPFGILSVTGEYID